MVTDLALASATELLAAFAARRASPVEATAAVLARIERLDRDFNAFCLVDAEAALAQARLSEARWLMGEPAGPLDGVPTTIKDMFLTRGWPTLRGTRTIDPAGPWQEDSPLVARLREAGAVLVGKTTQSEFGWKGVCDSPLYGVTRNPWNRAMTPGGSSGGAGVAAALGMGSLHAGGDGAGSIRIPAAFCGIYGLKPSFGRVPNYPAKMPGSITHAGPMTRTVADAALMLNVMAEPDARDWRSLPFERRDWRSGLDGGVEGWRVAWCRTFGRHRLDPEVAGLAEAAVRRLERLGAHVEEVELDMDDVRHAFAIYYNIRFTRLCTLLSPQELEMLDPGIIAVAEKGSHHSMLDVLGAEAVREELGLRMRRLHQTYDLLVTPQMPLTAFEAGSNAPGDAAGDWMEWSPYTYPFNFTQQPAASVPCGFASDGLPVAVQIVTDRYREDLVLRASRALEAEMPFSMPKVSG
jgi:aspartyl-tRNA(Asn)/glutamyl-tRNA(Gln) amidotransferase subunit A